MERHGCGLESITLKHPLTFTASIDAAFEAPPEGVTGLAARGLVAALVEDNRGKGGNRPQGDNGLANLVDFTVRRQRPVVRSSFSAEHNGLVYSTGQMLLFQRALHQIYLGIAQRPEIMVDLLEIGQLYPPLELCDDARAVYDAIRASDACEIAECSLFSTWCL